MVDHALRHRERTIPDVEGKQQFALEGSGQIRAKIYAKLERLPVQLDTRKSREVFPTVLRETVGMADPTRVQSILPIEDPVIPANRTDVRQ